MIPRGAPYIGWPDLIAAFRSCLTRGRRDVWQGHVEAAWAPHTVAMLSVRSGLDAVLGVLAFEAGSEVIVSAVTIPHILDILAHHGLVAVPVDVDPDTLEVSAADVEHAVTPRTKAILIAHLFGSRMPLDGIALLARARSLVLLEDCAQANDGSSYRGHAVSDVSFFSFGPIKRQTAMGGGLLAFRDGALADRVRARQATYPTLTRTAYLRRVATMAGVRLIAHRPMFNAYVAMCRLFGLDHDAVLGSALRGFSHGDLMTRLRQHPGAPLLTTLARRLNQDCRPEVARRVAVVETVTAEYPTLCRAGSRAAHHSHWLFPMRSARADALMHHLWRAGYDATRGASNLCCVPAPSGRNTPRHAIGLMDQVLYLPLCPTATREEMRAMARTIRAFDDERPAA